MTQKRLSVAIIGGGIGGLSAALSLLRAGVDVHVFERARVIHELGAGIAVSPNAVRILYRNGLMGTLELGGVKTLAWDYHRWEDGRRLYRSPIAGVMETEFGFPLYHMHRADLVKGMIQALPAERLHMEHKCVRFVDDSDRVEVEFENGARVQADALIGADGIRSMVRQTLFGPEQPRFTGSVAYRGLVPSERVAHLKLEATAQIWTGPGKHFVHYFVRNQQLINFVALIDQESWKKESWMDRGEVADVLAAFEGWHPQIRSILGAVDETFLWALFDRQPMPRWSVGRVTLLGDACHPMLPSKAQGSAQAIEDGATLALCLSLAGKSDVPAALKKYEAIRMERVARVQREAQDNRTRNNLPDGPAQQARDAEMAKIGTDFSPQAITWLYGYDAENPELMKNYQMESPIPK
jgi:salicylate hydroxylase